MPDNIITVDLGGTKILTAIIKGNQIVRRVKVATDSSQGADKMVDDVAASVKQAMDEENLVHDDIKAVCLGVPGTVNPGTGMIGNAPNLYITNYNIKESLEKKINFPVIIENDVNLGALGIKKFEFEDKIKNALVVFIGTGIGGAFIFDGRIYRGSGFYAGEIGHMKVTAKGALGGEKGKPAFEQIASRTAMVNAIEKDIRAGKNSELKELVLSNTRIKSKALAQAVKNNDQVAVKHIKKGSKIIGTVLGSITTLLNLDTIVLGGGVIEAMSDFMTPYIEKSFNKAVLKEPGEQAKIVVTKLGDDAPLYGGVALAEEFMKG